MRVRNTVATCDVCGTVVTGDENSDLPKGWHTQLIPYGYPIPDGQSLRQLDTCDKCTAKLNAAVQSVIASIQVIQATQQ